MKSKIEIEYTPFKQKLIRDIAGNLFVVSYYYDLDGKVKMEIKPYEDNTQILKNNICCNNI